MPLVFQPAQPAGKLGAIVVDPYGNAPLTALVELDSHVISDVKVTVHGKGEKGVPVTYTVGKSRSPRTMAFLFLASIKSSQIR